MAQTGIEPAIMGIRDGRYTSTATADGYNEIVILRVIIKIGSLRGVRV